VPVAGDDDAALRRLLAEEDAALLADRTYLRGGPDPDFATLRARLLAMARPVFPLEGRDALALGARPGPAVGEALRATRAVWLAGGCVADKAALLPVLRARLDDRTATHC
ncbi:MAG TPA: CCA tRNA nucleotidyltransferase, partial [Acetobacteraceae bacterium]|nr:CCA tRNA nucleotidyltransferase [Acetobacteraceae bacterium]